MIVDIDVVDRTVHRIEASRLECHVHRSPRDGSGSWLYVGSDNTATMIVVGSDGTELGSYPGFVRPFFDADGRLLAKVGDLDAVGEYLELDPLTGDVLSESLFEAEQAAVTNGGTFISVIYESVAGVVPEPSALLDPDTYEVVVDLSAETARAIDGRTSADDSRFGYVSRDGRLLVWDTETGGLVIDAPVAEQAEAIAFSPDGSNIALLVEGGTLQIRSGIDGQINRTIDADREPVMAIDWTEGDQIAVLRTVGVVDFIAIEGGGLYEASLPCCDVNEVGFVVADGIPNAYATVVNLETGIVRIIDVVTGEEDQVDLSPWVFDPYADMHMNRDKTIVLIRPPFEMFRVDLDGTAEEPRYPFGDRFVLQDETPGQEPMSLHGSDEIVFLKLTRGSVPSDFDDAVLEEIQVGVIDVDTMETVVEPYLIDLSNESPKVNHAELLHGGILLVAQDSGDGGTRQQYFDVAGERFLEFTLPFDSGWWELTPDRRYLLTTDSNDVVQRWDVETGESIVLPVLPEPDPPEMLSDGRFMIQTRSGEYELWDIEAAAAIGVLADVGPRVFTLPIIHPDESHVWLHAGEALVKIPLDPQRWFEMACEFAGRSLTEAEWRDLVGADRPYRDACAA